MQPQIIEAILNYGILPGITLYLIFTIVKDHKDEFKKIQDKIENQTKEIDNAINKQNEAINELTNVMGKIQNSISNQMNSLIIKLIDVTTREHDGGDE